MNLSSTQLSPVEPVKPVAAYVGGKRRLAKTIITRIEAIPHISYAEPFVGMGGVFLRRTTRPKSEVINDFSKEVTNFFRVLQRHYIAFLEMMRFQLTTRAEFDRLIKTNPETLTDLERAARFLYLQRTAFGGKASQQNFGVARQYPGRFDITKLVPMLEDLHTRLSGVVIECLPYENFIQRYDRSGTLFYLDPPYFNCEDDYGKDMFAQADFTKLAEILRNLQGRFILSINDCPEVRKIFDGFTLEEVKTSYSLTPKGNIPANELLIS